MPSTPVLKNVRFLLLAVLLALLLPAACFAQFTISGRVINQVDTKPVAFCSVFLSNATIGNKTANDGSFILKNAKPGKYILVVSIIGYDTYSQEAVVTDKDIILPDITISPKTISLNEVVIKPDLNRERNYEWFKNEFLGVSELAKECKILNPEVIDLSYDESEKTLTASSSDFIEIENSALGYRVKYLLTSFLLNNKVETARKIGYEGSVLFEKMQGSTGQERRWQKRRQAVYENSPMHFMRAILSNQLEDEGFRALQIAICQNPDRPADSLINFMISKYQNLRSAKPIYRDSLSFWKAKLKLPKILQKLNSFPLDRMDLLYPTDQPGLMALSCGNDNIQVNYSKEHHFSANGTGNFATTILSFNGPYTFFDNNGWIANPKSVSFSGAWGRNRVAELLPVDYEAPLKTDDTPEPKNIIAQSSSTNNITPLNTELLKIAAASDSLNKEAAAEKIYLQLDKPYYALNDTLWFKTYLLNAIYHTPSVKSAIVYIDIANDSNKVVMQYRLPVGNGLTWGNLGLSDKEFTSGTYILRAYTSWMRNLGEDCFFYKRFYISSAGENNLLASSKIDFTTVNGINKVNVKLLFSDMNKSPYAVKSLQVQLLSGAKRIYNQKFQTGVDGVLNVSFNIPEKAPGLAVIATSELKDKKVVVPILLKRVENADVQFLPEGGNLVAGLPAHIGFKIIGADGKGLNLSGVIINQDQKQVAEFSSVHSGMGSFNMAIKAGESYTARVILPGGSTKLYPLPAIKGSGTLLNIKNAAESDSVEISVAVTKDLITAGSSYFLIGKARGVVCYAAGVSFIESNIIKKKVAKSLFPTGITHFTLMTIQQEPLNERLVFINHEDNLDIRLSTDKSSYALRDSIALKLKVTDASGRPVTGNFSIAVTDNAQVKADTLTSGNIVTRFLLTADLKGYIEQPDYYFSKKPGAWKALDNLLLTQGWIGYDWKQALNPSKNQFEAETEFKVTGRIVNVFNKPVKGTDVLLFSKLPSILKDTLTDNEGKFIFSHFARLDTPLFIVQARNKRGKSFNVMVNVDEVKPPAFTSPALPASMPWYLNSDTTLLNFTKNNALAKQEYAPGGGQILKEVKITAKKVIKDSQNLNGPGNADQVFDEKEMEKLAKKTFLDILQERVKRFGEKYFPGLTPNGIPYSWYFIEDKTVVFIIDGVNLTDVLPMEEKVNLRGDLKSSIKKDIKDVPFEHKNDVRDYLKSHTAEDIKGIEVNSSSKYAMSYYRRFAPLDAPLGSLAFIEITTRSGHGPLIDNTPGMYTYKPLPFSWPKQFYKPKYITKDAANKIPDLRSTIDWEPNVITDENGEATISFYAAGSASKYTVEVEGTDMKGNVGFQEKKITIKN